MSFNAIFLCAHRFYAEYPYFLAEKLNTRVVAFGTLDFHLTFFLGMSIFAFTFSQYFIYDSEMSNVKLVSSPDNFNGPTLKILNLLFFKEHFKFK